jgi:hypothetical protein
MIIAKNTTPRGRVAFAIDVPRAQVQIKAPWLPDFAPLDDRDDSEIVVVHANNGLAVLCIQPI